MLFEDFRSRIYLTVAVTAAIAIAESGFEQPLLGVSHWGLA